MSDQHGATVVVIAAVAVVSLALCLMAMGAWRRSGNGKLLFVGGAFFVFFAKNAFTAIGLWDHLFDHGPIELVGSLLDLATVTLLVAPLLRR